MSTQHNTQIAVAGGGIAGLATCIELLQAKPNTRITLIDAQGQLGGLARQAFGGMALVGTQLQKLAGIQDSPELALSDWHQFAEFQNEDYWPKQWAQYYVENSNEKIFKWLKTFGVRFFPVVNWVERGLYQPGNSVPRYHVVWGTAHFMIEQLKKALSTYQLDIRFHCRVSQIEKSASKWILHSASGDEIHADKLVIASGGITGQLDNVRKLLPNAPQTILNGSHPTADGHLHAEVENLGANITHSQNMWNYAAGIAHPQPQFEGHGLSLIPCKTALWVNALGERIGPVPLVTGFDTHHLCEQVSQQPHGYTWQVLNLDIAARELAISGADHNEQLKNRNAFRFIWNTLTANNALVNQMVNESRDFICADSLSDLVDKMNQLAGANHIQAEHLQQQLEAFDRQILRGENFYTDDQLRRIALMRRWRADKVRTCRNKTILLRRKSPLLAIRLKLISRKSLGGIQTNLHSQVLNTDNQVIPDLYAVGEASGFGGGGISGKRSLEGTFLSGCILTAQNAAQHILADMR